MANRYWIGNNLAWNNTAGWSNQSFTENPERVGGAPLPTSVDDVFFDAYSGDVTSSASSLTCRHFDTTGYNGRIWVATSRRIDCYGDMILNKYDALVYVSNSYYVNFWGNGVNHRFIALDATHTSPSLYDGLQIIEGGVGFFLLGSGSTVTMTGNFKFQGTSYSTMGQSISTSIIYLGDTNGNNAQVDSFSTYGSVGEINLRNSSTFTIGNMSNQKKITAPEGTEVIVLPLSDNAPFEFLPDSIIDKLTIRFLSNLTGILNVIIGEVDAATAPPTINNLIIDNVNLTTLRTINFYPYTTPYTINNLTTNAKVKIASVTAGTKAKFYSNNGKIRCDTTNVTDNEASGAIFYAGKNAVLSNTIGWVAAKYSAGNAIMFSEMF